MVEGDVESKQEVLEAMRKQLDICRQLNESLVNQTKTVETQIVDMEHRLKPVTTMWDTISSSVNNINSALEQIESVCSTTRDIDTTIKTLQQSKNALFRDPTTYFDTMRKALELIRELHQAQKNREMLSNYQDFQSKQQELAQALKGAKKECVQHFNLLLKKLVS